MDDTTAGGSGGTDRDPRQLFAMAIHALQSKRVTSGPTATHYDGYRYVSGKDVRLAVMEAAAAVGLAVELVEARVQEERELETRKGNLQWMTDVTCTFEVTEVRGGHSKRYEIVGRRTNDSDKGVMHAIAQAEKIFLSRLAMIHEGEDPEADKVEQSSRSTRPRREGGQTSGRNGRGSGKKPKRFRPDPEGWLDTHTGAVLPSCPCDVGAPMLAGVCQHPNCDHRAPNPGSVTEPTTESPPEKEENDPKAERKKESYADLVSRTKKEYAQAVGNVEPWEEDALAFVHPDLPDDITEWIPAHYQLARGLMRKEGAVTLLARAVKEAANRQPAQADEIALLRELSEKARLGFKEQSQVETAIQSGWAHAVAETLRWVGPRAKTSS